MWSYNYPNELYHHGILGQKWGIRRYQKSDGSLTRLGKKKQLRNNKPRQISAKKALQIASQETNLRKIERTKVYEDYDKTTSESEKKKLFKRVLEKEKAYVDATLTEDNVKSYIRGMSGSPLKQYEFQTGELGRQYVVKLMNDEKYKDIFWDSATGQLKKK